MRFLYFFFLSGKCSQFLKPKKNTFDFQKGHILKLLAYSIAGKSLKVVYESKQMRSAARQEERRSSAHEMLFAWLRCLEGRSP